MVVVIVVGLATKGAGDVVRWPEWVVLVVVVVEDGVSLLLVSVVVALEVSIGDGHGDLER